MNNTHEFVVYPPIPGVRDLVTQTIESLRRKKAASLRESFTAHMAILANAKWVLVPGFPEKYRFPPPHKHPPYRDLGSVGIDEAAHTNCCPVCRKAPGVWTSVQDKPGYQALIGCRSCNLWGSKHLSSRPITQSLAAVSAALSEWNQLTTPSRDKSGDVIPEYPYSDQLQKRRNEAMP